MFEAGVRACFQLTQRSRTRPKQNRCLHLQHDSALSLSETSFGTRRTSSSVSGTRVPSRQSRKPKCRSNLPDVRGKRREMSAGENGERLRTVIQSLEMVVESCFGRSTTTQDLGDRLFHKTGGPPPPKQRARVSGYEGGDQRWGFCL